MPWQRSPTSWSWYCTIVMGAAKSDLTRCFIYCATQLFTIWLWCHNQLRYPRPPSNPEGRMTSKWATVHSLGRTSMTMYRMYQAPGQEPEVIESVRWQSVSMKLDTRRPYHWYTSGSARSSHCRKDENVYCSHSLLLPLLHFINLQLANVGLASLAIDSVVVSSLLANFCVS